MSKQNIGSYKNFNEYKTKLYEIILENNIDKAYNDDLIYNGLLKLSSVNDNEKQQKFLNLSTYLEKQIDKINKGYLQKVPAVLKLGEIISSHYDVIKDYNDDEIALLAWYGFCTEEPFLTEMVYKNNKKILDAVINKSKDNLNDQYKIMFVIDGRVKYNSPDFDKNIDDAVDFINNTSMEEINKLSNKKSKKLFDNISLSGIRKK